jgi:pimeloyl-ACP methyl ester carboxylesterase
MQQTVSSLDGVTINFESSGGGDTAILFVHGWLGNQSWWDHARDAFSKNYQIIQMDLAGHGRSSVDRKIWSVKSYAQDIKAVVEKLSLKKVILVGHSMSGSNVIEAYHLMPERVVRVILVDTLNDMDHLPTMKEAAPLFEGMRHNYQDTIQRAIPQYLFAKTSPKAVVEKILHEFLKVNPALAISSLEPFYKTDIREACSRVKVPVRAINANLYPTNAEANRKCFQDYDYELITDVGHYPMLESPKQFNNALGRMLKV